MATARKVSPEIKERILELHGNGMRIGTIGKVLKREKGKFSLGWE
tara:strand:- start:391 stop:525 length:135 start_codon:yes stop_codon:yes gene_type:complete